MKNKILTLCLLVLVAAGGFFSIYLREKPPAVPQTERAKIETQIPTSSQVEDLKIGILGESRSDGSEDLSFNQKILSELFQVLNERNISAIFFTGNLTLGWSKTQEAAKEKPQKKNLDLSKNLLRNDWTAKGFLYDPTIFRSQLKQFYTFVNSSFSYPIAFYPMMGDHEAIGLKATEIFEEELKVKSDNPSIDQISYSVSIGDAFFAVIPTNYYDTEKKEIIEHTITPDTLTWLKTVLNEAKAHHKYLFVMGHEPAFSTLSIFNKPFGLESHPEQRDAFWNILKEHGVLAYFSSHEHVYDRSNRDGVWQIISGGGGSPLNQGGENNHAFFHCLLLTIPQQEEGVPSVTVLDKEGNIRDSFELNQEKQPLHQFRIS